MYIPKLFEEKEIKEFAKGNVLDMGTGSGVLAREASRLAKNAIGVDLNPDSINYCKEKYKDVKNLKFYESNLFSHFKKNHMLFDLIIFILSMHL